MEENENQELAPHQYENILQENDVPLLDVSPAAIRSYIPMAIGFFIIVAVMGFTVRIPQEINLSFVLKGGSNEKIFRYPEPVYVQDIWVHPGEKIQPNDTLMSISSSRIIDLLGQYAVYENRLDLLENTGRELLEKQATKLENQKNLLLEDTQSMKKDLEKLQKLASTESTTLQEQMSLSNQEYERNTKLHDSNIISDSDFERLKQVWLEAQRLLQEQESDFAQNEVSIKNQVRQTQQQIAQLETEIERLQTSHALEVAEAAKAKEHILEQLKIGHGTHFTIKDGKLFLLSSTSGQVSMIAEKESKLAAGEILMRLHLETTNHYVYALADTRTVGRINNGHKVILKYDGLPYFYYGTMTGVVESISSSPNDEGQFPVYIEIQDAGKLEDKVEKGVTGTASVTAEELTLAETVWKTFLGKVTIAEK